MTVPPPYGEPDPQPYSGDAWAQPYPQDYPHPYAGQPYPGQPYPGQPYPGPYPYPPPAGPRPTNAMAIASIVCAFILAPLGVIFGHISLSQIKKTGEEGRGLAIAGLVISYMITVLTIVVVALSVLFVV